MELDDKESMRMVIRAIEIDSIDRVEDIVGRLIDLFNSDESREFLEGKMQRARDGLVRLKNAMRDSLYEGMRAMRQLVTDIRIHLWSGNSAISRFQFNGQSLHYLLTRASNVLKKDSLSNEEKVKEIWDGIIESLAQDEDESKATERLEKFLSEWRGTCRLPERAKRSVENQIKTNFERGLEQQRSDIENLFSQLREYFEGLRSKLEKTQEAVKSAELEGMIWGGFAGASIATGGITIGLTIAAASVYAGRKLAQKKSQTEAVKGL